MSKPIFRYAALDGDNNSYFIENGEVSFTSGDPVFMYDVVEWEQMGPMWKRHERYLGVFIKFLPEKISYVKDMAHISRYFYHTYDINADMHLRVDILNSTTQLYNLMGVYKVDHSNNTGTLLTSEIQLMQGGLAEALIANEDTICEIPLTEYGDKILLDGINVLGNFTFETEAGGHVAVGVSIGQGVGSQTFGIANIGQEGTIVPGAAKTEVGAIDVEPIAGSDFAGAVMYHGLITSDFNLKMELPISYNVLNGAGMLSKLQLQWRRYPDADFTSGPTTNVMWESGFQANGPYSDVISIDEDLTISDGDYFMLVFRVQTDTIGFGASIGIDFPATPVPITMSYITRQPATECRARRARSVFSYVTYALGNMGYETRSDLLDSTSPFFGLRPTSLRFTCGDAIRQIHQDADGNAKDPVLKITMKDFAKFAFVKLNAGIGIELDDARNEILRLESLEYFFQTDHTVYEFGDAIGQDYRLEPYNEHRANNLMIGYKDQNYDNVNGKYEYNSWQQWRTNITPKIQDLDYTCPFRADVYGIEVLRANLENKKTTDASGDNDVFLIQTEYYENEYGQFLPDRSFAIISGVPDTIRATMYNQMLSGRHDLRRMGPWLLANYGGSLMATNERIIFQSGTKNTDLRYFEGDIFAGTLYENENIVLPDIAIDGYAGLYQAKKISFPAEIPQKLYSFLTANPHGIFTATINKVAIKFFLLTIGETPGSNETFNVEGLLTTDTELPDNF